MQIRKLILPVAGLGKRLQPLTFSLPKNLVSLRGRPLVEYAIDEAAAAGLAQIILVASPEHKTQYEKYLLQAQKRYPALIFHLQLQPEAWGDGHAVLMAQDLIAGEPFAVRFCDDVIVDRQPTLPQLIRLAETKAAPAILLERVPEEEVSRYGVVRGEKIEDRTYRLQEIVEKPARAEAPSNLIVIGGYALTGRVMETLAEMWQKTRPAKDALRIAHALGRLAADGEAIYGWEFPGVRLDCGTLAGLHYAEEYLAAHQIEVLPARS